MKLIIIDLLAYILPTNYFIFFNNLNSEFIVIKEMGAYKFFIFLVLISVLFLYLIFKNSKKIFNRKNINIKLNNNLFFVIIIFFNSCFLIYFTYPEYALNPNIFYKSSTGQNIFNLFSYLSLFFATNVAFYFFTNQLIKNSRISLLVALLWMVSSIHLANLYPSLLRDYVKVILFYINFMFIIYILKNKINEKNLHIVFYSLFFMSFSFIFKADLKMLFPVYLYALVVGMNLNFKNKVKIISVFLLMGILFIYLTSSALDDRNLQRFGASLSNELYDFSSRSSVGPWNDGLFFYNSCAYYSCNMFKTFIITNFYESQLLHVKFFHVLSEVIFMPFKYGLIFEETNIVHKIILYKFAVFSLVYKFKYIYLFILFALLIKTLMRGNYFLLNLLLIFLYLNFIFTLQIQIRHFFFLEGLSLIILIISAIESYKLIKELNEYVKKI